MNEFGSEYVDAIKSDSRCTIISPVLRRRKNAGAAIEATANRVQTSFALRTPAYNSRPAIANILNLGLDRMESMQLSELVARKAALAVDPVAFVTRREY